MYIDPAASGLFVPYGDLSATAITETKQRIADTILATLGGAANVTERTLEALYDDEAQGGSAMALYPAGRTTTPRIAAFVNAWLLRQADWMDSYRLAGRTQAGHPSDQFAVIFALCNDPRMTGERLVETVHLAYQLWRAWTEAMPDTTTDGWDNTTKLSLCVPVIAATFHGASVERLNEAVRLSASSGAVLAQVRRGALTNWKSGNSGFVSANSLWAWSLSATFQGSEGLLDDTDGGWSRNVTAIRCEPQGVSPDDVYRFMEMKLFPCFQFGQAPVWCGTRLHHTVIGSIDDVTAIEISLPQRDHASATRRNWQQAPQTPSEADHNIPFCLATALVHGTLNPQHYRAEHLMDETTRRLMSVMAMVPMSSAAAEDIACSVRVTLADGSESAASIRWDEMGASHLDGPDRCRYRDELIVAKRQATEAALDIDLGPVVAMVRSMEHHDGPQLLRAIADAVSTLTV